LEAEEPFHDHVRRQIRCRILLPLPFRWQQFYATRNRLILLTGKRWYLSVRLRNSDFGPFHRDSRGCGAAPAEYQFLIRSEIWPKIHRPCTWAYRMLEQPATDTQH
jgi:hypothetical protein